MMLLIALVIVIGIVAVVGISVYRQFRAASNESELNKVGKAMGVLALLVAVLLVLITTLVADFYEYDTYFYSTVGSMAVIVVLFLKLDNAYNDLRDKIRQKGAPQVCSCNRISTQSSCDRPHPVSKRNKLLDELNSLVDSDN